MELTIIGSASAEPNPDSASSSYLLDTGRGQILLECGHGAAAKLLLYTSIERISAVLISHMHPDHWFDLVPLKYFIQFNGHPKLPLFIPPTGPRVLDGLVEALDEEPQFWARAFEVEVFDPARGLSLFGLDVQMTPTQHFIPAWSMRFADEADGDRVFGYTSDTSAIDAVVAHLRGSNLLLAEAAVERQTRPPDQQGHMTPSEAARLARLAGAAQLVLTHYPSANLKAMEAEAASEFSGPCSVAVEGARYLI